MWVGIRLMCVCIYLVNSCGYEKKSSIVLGNSLIGWLLQLGIYVRSLFKGDRSATNSNQTRQ